MYCFPWKQITPNLLFSGWLFISLPPYSTLTQERELDRRQIRQQMRGNGGGMRVSNATRGPGSPGVRSPWREMTQQLWALLLGGPGFPILILTHDCLWLRLSRFLVSPGTTHTRSTYTEGNKGVFKVAFWIFPKQSWVKCAFRLK